MSLESWAVLASVVFTGLWSGLFALLTSVLHPMLARMSPAGFANFMHEFLPIARRAPFNYIEVAGMVVSPIVALIALGTVDSSFVLTAIGLAFTIAGPLLVSSRLAEPNYDVIMAWDPDRMPDGWGETRRRYFLYNWIRAAATWTAFALFLAALMELQ